MPTFATPGPIAATVEVAGARVRVTASDRTDTVVLVEPIDETNRSHVRVADRTKVDQAVSEVSSLGSGSPQVDQEAGKVTIPVGERGAQLLSEVVRRMDAAGIELAELALHRPTLDDVFMALTGHAAEEDGGDGTATGDGAGGRGRRRPARSAR